MIRRLTLYRSGGDGDYLSRWKRIVHIDARLRDGSRPSAAKLARECGVSTKTVYRDLEALRDELGAPIQYDSSARGYTYAGSGFAIPAVTLNERDLFALMVAENALAQYEGTPVAGHLRAAFEKVLAALPGELRSRHALAARAIHFSGLPPVRIDPATWSRLTGAIEDRERVEIDYFLPATQTVEARSVDPLLLVVRDREWFLVARTVRSGNTVLFFLPRISAVRGSGQHFERDPEFSAEAFFAEGFNAMRSNSGTRLVRLRYAKDHAHLADERTWTSQQTVRRGRDGRATVEFRTNALFEVERKVLSYGGRVEVLAPKDLRSSVRAAGRAISQGHA
ncbi:MAG: WYL domain-containing protein [Planctomycetes bacterium]|nr:WYL domain-containing protein [Planctomycetota bacterium]